MDINYLDSKGYYFENVINIITGQNMNIEEITSEQAKNILKFQVINYIAKEDLTCLKEIANINSSTIPAPSRVGQLLISEPNASKDGIILNWYDLQEIPSISVSLEDFLVPRESKIRE